MVDRTHQQGIAVGCRSRGFGRAYGAARARPVVDDDLLSPGCGEFLSDDAGEKVGRASRWKGNDHAYGFAWIRLRLRQRAACGRDEPSGHEHKSRSEERRVGKECRSRWS